MEEQQKLPMFKLGYWLLVAFFFFFVFKGQDIFFRIIASIIFSFLGVYAVRLLGKFIKGVF